MLPVALLASACLRPAATADTLRAANPGLPSVRELARVQLVATGDAMMHGMVQRAASEADQRAEDGTSQNNGGYDVIFAGLAPLVEPADLAFVNLEFPIAPKVGRPNREMVFNAPPVVLDALREVGFDVVSAANNHSYDQGRPGLVETLEHLERSGLTWLGAGMTCEAARAARHVEQDGLKIAFLAATDLFNVYLNAGEDQPCVAVLDEEKVAEQAAAAREAGAELVILSVHWGVEYKTEPELEHIEQAHRLIEAGVDVILGHHPHVLQPIEVIEASDGRVGLVAYSLGNLVSSQSAFYRPGLSDPTQGYPRDGLLLSVDLVKREYGRGDRKIVRSELAALRAHPLWTTHRKRSGRLELHVDPVSERVRLLAAELEGATDEGEVVRLTQELLEMQQRQRLTARIVGQQWVEASF
jgi:hypothetical protein